MTYVDTDLVAEVRRNREMLLEQHGGIEGLHKYMEDERPKLEQDGWDFVPIDYVSAKRRKNISA
jgi:hypothetical protein